MDNGANNNNNVNSNGNNNVAIVGMILGVVSIVLCLVPILPVALGIAGLVLGIKGLKDSNSLPQNNGKGMGIAGIACGAIGLIIGAIMTIGWIAAFAEVKEEYDDAKKQVKKYQRLTSYVQVNDEEPVATILDNYNV